MPDRRRNRRYGRARKCAIKRASEALTFNGDRAQRFQGTFLCRSPAFTSLILAPEALRAARLVRAEVLGAVRAQS
jgi:hypothetical protein